MPYSTVADFREQLPEPTLVALTDDSQTGLVDEARIDWAIAKADALVDAHCAARYQVPFVPVPMLARSFSVDLGVYNLFARRPHMALPEGVKDRNNQALAYLKRVQAGDAGMGADAATPQTATTPVGWRVAGNERLFPSSLLEKM
jgi:phage gp36-like protein